MVELYFYSQLDFMVWRDKYLSLSIGCVGHRIALNVVKTKSCTFYHCNIDSLVVYIVASGCVQKQSAGKKSERKGEKIMEQWGRIYNEELHNWYLQLIWLG